MLARALAASLAAFGSVTGPIPLETPTPPELAAFAELPVRLASGNLGCCNQSLNSGVCKISDLWWIVTDLN